MCDLPPVCVRRTFQIVSVPLQDFSFSVLSLSPKCITELRDYSIPIKQCIKFRNCFIKISCFSYLKIKVVYLQNSRIFYRTSQLLVINNNRQFVIVTYIKHTLLL